MIPFFKFFITRKICMRENDCLMGSFINNHIIGVRSFVHTQTFLLGQRWGCVKELWPVWLMRGWSRTLFLVFMFFPLSCWKSYFLVCLINIDEQRIGWKIQDFKNLVVYRNGYVDVLGTENTNVSSWDTNLFRKCFLCETGTIEFLSKKRVTQTGFRNRPSFRLNHSWKNRIQTENIIPILSLRLVYIMKKKIKKASNYAWLRKAKGVVLSQVTQSAATGPRKSDIWQAWIKRLKWALYTGGWPRWRFRFYVKGILGDSYLNYFRKKAA